MPTFFPTFTMPRLPCVVLAVLALLSACSGETPTVPKDIAPPSLVLTTDTILPRDTLRLSGSASDDTEVARVSYAIGDGPGVDIPIVPGTTVALSADVPLNGASRVRVAVYDRAGNVTSRNISVILDRMEPSLRTFITPALSGAASAEIIVGGRDWAEPGYGRIVGANHQINGGVVVHTQASPAQTVDVLAYASLGDGANTIRATMVDWAGNQRWSTRGAIRSAPATQVAAKGGHSCAVLRDGKLYCWGDNTRGQIGTSSAGKWSGVPVLVPNLPPVKAVSAGARHTCALDVNGYAYCWGTFMDFAQVIAAWPVPRLVSETLRFTQISSGGDHVCGLTAGGAAHCWGVNAARQLGSDTFTSTMQPVAVSGGLRFTKLASGFVSNCGIIEDGGLYCWGSESGGSPVAAGSGVKFRSVTMGIRHTCGVGIDGRGYCWGEALHGLLGNSATGGAQVVAAPLEITGGLRFREIGAGLDHSCGITVDSEMYCWGDGNHGQLGTTHSTHELIPIEHVPIRSLRGLPVESLSVGYTHSCAVSKSGGAYCWGKEEHGELGNDT